MKAEIISIGDEIMYGHTIDSNSAYISQRLAELGIEVVYQTSVGDEVSLIVEAINQARQRVNLIITTGGLGPTHDDVTMKGIVKAFKKNLVFHPEILEKIKQRYEKRGMEMPQINQNQALIPQGAKYFDNAVGSAPGILIQEEEIIFMALPGVPREMRYLTDNEVIPFLSKQKIAKKIVHQKIRTTGIVESALYEIVEGIIKESKDVKIAFLPGYHGVDIRLTVSARDEKAGKILIDQVQNKIMEKAGEYVYSTDSESQEELVGRLLREKKMKLAVAESCTGGLLASKITNIPGSSDYFDRGIVTYSNQAKTQILGVPEEMIRKYGAVSQQVAEAMAKGVVKISGADVGVGITGIAGPAGGTTEKPVGLVYIGLANKQKAWVEEFLFGDDRQIIRERSSYAALNMIRLYLLGKKYV